MTTVTSTPTSTPTLPGALSLGFARAAVELKTFFRERDTVIFTFALPIFMLIILGSIFSDTVEGTTITASQLFVGGMIAGGIASTSFVTLGAGIATDRSDGTIKRLRGTPLPPVSYFIGKVLLVAVTSFAELVLLLAVGTGLFDLSLPSEPGRWLTLAWVFTLGVTACALIGIAISSLARSPRSAGALSTFGLIALSFASGVYVVPVARLPEPLITIGSWFPLKWMAQGMRSVFLPDALTTHEVAGAWEHGRTALVLGAWCIGGLILCLTTFRWRGPRDR